MKTNTNPPVIQDVDKIRIQMLFQQNGTAHIGSFVNACIYVYLSLGFIPHRDLFLWSGWFALLFCVRLGMYRFFVQNHITQKKDFDPRYWENIFTWGVLGAGLTWGVAASVMLPRGAMMHHAFMGFLLAGTTAGASIAYCTSVRASQAFIHSAILPFIIRLFMEDTNFHYGMAGLLICYLVLYGRLTSQINSYAVNSIALRFEKDKLLEELKTAHTQAMHSSKMAALGEMAGGIAHEINNPLGIIRGNNQLIADLAETGRLSPATVNPLVGKIESTVMRIAKVITGLRAFARNGENDPFKKTRVRALIEETLDFCQMRFKSHEVSLIVGHIPEKLDIDCRSIQMSQVLLNLLNNAFDAVAGAQEKWVRIDVEETSDKVSLIITDSGPGIPSPIREKIMHPLFTTKEAGHGTGLGLSISRGIVEGHSGVLYLDIHAKNTRFVATLPKYQVNQEEKLAA